MSTLSSYLAKNYLTASTPTHSSDASDRPKKRRKKSSQSSTQYSLVIADDDDLLLSSSNNQNGRDENDEGVPTMYEGKAKSAEFRRKKSSAWKAIASPDGGADSEPTARRSENGREGEDAEANRILASAAADQASRQAEVEMEDAPAIVDTGHISQDENDQGAPRMESGVKAGLQTAADTERLLEKEERQRRKEARSTKSKSKDTPEEETIYRDATGRRIDVSLRRAELRAQQAQIEQEKRKEKQEAMGEVQRRQREEGKRELEEAKFLSLGRGEDDEEMNERLRGVRRWDDPMAEYMAEKEAEDGVGEEGGAVAKREGRREGGLGVGAVAKVKGKKLYQGFAPPNRYGILPGWRWDGVDRGNGFEKEWFQARSRSKRNEEMSYLWQQDE